MLDIATVVSPLNPSAYKLSFLGCAHACSQCYNALGSSPQHYVNRDPIVTTMSCLPKHVQDEIQKYGELFCNCTNDGESTIVFWKDRILELLFANAGSYRSQIHTSKAAPHPKNRDEECLSVIRFHNCISKVRKVGFSWNACRDALAFEDHPLTKHIANKAQSECLTCPTASPDSTNP